ncbi:hypothetical protein DESUT3_16330 [Desulfuromonas versatilis]|uniref:Cyclic nucleotide-binding domain-containing protein n=1 Tax=Desulfuromonas versatilis TaxID=2802975 RepID=A0ABM8HRM5_9BACT|nr:Crp/Fnr family transcriptional regulator [Desulfuromonas versatilis]BCR04564.1 hypothetical protein DESUT3_16330 [Desulfuromonas versatilis]
MDLKVPLQDIDKATLTQENPCSDGICRERLCGRMKRELRYFRFLAEEDLDEAAAYFECRQVENGKSLWREGDEGAFAAFVISGRVEINKLTEFGAKPIVVGIYSRGAVIGERSLLEDGGRSETAVVLDHADLVILTRASFQRMVEEHPGLGVKLLEGMLLTVSRRLQRSYERLAAIF